MPRKLTKKQKGFVKDYVLEDNATEAVVRNYDVKDRLVARVVGAENLTKPNIQEAIEKQQKSIAERIPDELLVERHLELLNKRETKKVFNHDSGEWTEVLLDQPHSDVKDALDKGYKLKGAYAAEKNINLNVNAEIINDEDLAKLAEKLIELQKKDEL